MWRKFSLGPDPHSDFHPKMNGKYPVDMETKLRLVEFVPGDKGNPRTWERVKMASYSFPRYDLFCCRLGFCYRHWWFGRSSRILQGFSGGRHSLLSDGFRCGFWSRPLYCLRQCRKNLAVPVFMLWLWAWRLFYYPLCRGEEHWHFVDLPFRLTWCFVQCAHDFDRWLPWLTFGMQTSVVKPWLCSRLLHFWVRAWVLFLVVLLRDYTSTWRWVYWAYLIIAGVLYTFFLLIVPETHHNTLLRRRAAKLRKLTGDESYRCLAELQVRSFLEVARVSLLRPFLLLSELIISLVTLTCLLSTDYCTCFFFAYPVIYMGR